VLLAEINTRGGKAEFLWEKPFVLLGRTACDRCWTARQRGTGGGFRSYTLVETIRAYTGCLHVWTGRDL